MDKYCMVWNFTRTQSEFLKPTKKPPSFILLGFFLGRCVQMGKWRLSSAPLEVISRVSLTAEFQDQCKNEWSRNPTSSLPSFDLSAVDFSLSTLAKSLQMKSGKTFKFLATGQGVRVQDLPQINWARNEQLVLLLASWNEVIVDTQLRVPLTTGLKQISTNVFTQMILKAPSSP